MEPTDDAPRIVVVVLNWNGRDDTLRCLESLRAVDYPNWEVLVVDNGSEDGSVVAIQRSHPGIELLETGRNLGFAGGNNLGIRAALDRGAEFILLLNNDATVAPNILRAFERAASTYRDAGAFGAKIYLLSDPLRLWYAGIRWNPGVCSFEHIGQGMLDDEAEFGKVSETEYVCGCAMFIRASAVRAVGMLDERFFLLYEEVDWCFRARGKGFRCLFIPEAKIWHRVSASFGPGRSIMYEYFLFRNRLLWAERHLPLWRRLGVWANTMQVLFPLSGGRESLWRLFGRQDGVRRVYWEARERIKDWRAELREPSMRIFRKARWRAFFDYLARRFGDCPTWIRAAATGHR